MSDQDKHGVDVEAMKAPVSVQQLNAAKESLAYARTMLLSPPGSHGRSGDKAFYAQFLMRMNLEWTTSLETAGVSITDRLNLYVNPHFINSLTMNKIIELLIHEIEHIVYLHPIRGKELAGDETNKKNSHKMFNIAADGNINVPLTDLTENLGVTLERLNDQMKQMGSPIRLDPKDSAEIHYYKLRQFQEENEDKLPQGFGEGEGGECDDHGKWNESNGNAELAKAMVKEATNQAVRATGAGNCPSHIVKQYNELNKSLVDWKRQLQQFVVRTMKFSRERTRSRMNRRTGIVNPGSRKKPLVSLALIGDESGSMGDDQVLQLFSEIDKIASMGIKVYYIPMDCETGEVVEYKKGMKLSRTRAGGTYYGPGLEKAKELDVDGAIVFGDFDCADKPEKPKFGVLWVGINTESKAPANFGKVIYVKTEK